MGNQRSSVAISGNPTHLGIRAKVNIRRRFVTAQDAQGSPPAARHKRSAQRHELPFALAQPSSLCGTAQAVGRQSEAIRGNQRQSDVPTEQRRPLGSDWSRLRRPREVRTPHAAATAAASAAATAAAADDSDDNARSVNGIEEPNSNAVRLANNEPRRSSASCASRRT